MTSFTDQKPRIATVEDVNGRHGCTEPGNRTGFRCYLCGHVFKVSDQWRFVYATNYGLINFLTCAKCDGPDVLDRWKKQNEEAGQRFWWFGCKNCRV